LSRDWSSDVCSSDLTVIIGSIDGYLSFQLPPVVMGIPRVCSFKNAHFAPIPGGLGAHHRWCDECPAIFMYVKCTFVIGMVGNGYILRYPFFARPTRNDPSTRCVLMDGSCPKRCNV